MAVVDEKDRQCGYILWHVLSLAQLYIFIDKTAFHVI